MFVAWYNNSRGGMIRKLIIFSGWDAGVERTIVNPEQFHEAKRSRRFFLCGFASVAVGA